MSPEVAKNRRKLEPERGGEEALSGSVGGGFEDAGAADDDCKQTPLK